MPSASIRNVAGEGCRAQAEPPELYLETCGTFAHLPCPWQSLNPPPQAQRHCLLLIPLTSLSRKGSCDW